MGSVCIARGDNEAIMARTGIRLLVLFGEGEHKNVKPQTAGDTKL